MENIDMHTKLDRRWLSVLLAEQLGLFAKEVDFNGAIRK